MPLAKAAKSAYAISLPRNFKYSLVRKIYNKYKKGKKRILLVMLFPYPVVIYRDKCACSIDDESSWPLRESDSKRSRGAILQAWLSACTAPYVINQQANHPRLNRLCVTKTTKGDCRRVRRGGSRARGFAVVTGVKCSHGGVLRPMEKRDQPTDPSIRNPPLWHGIPNRTICYSSFVTRAIRHPIILIILYYPVLIAGRFAESRGSHADAKDNPDDSRNQNYNAQNS